MRADNRDSEEAEMLDLLREHKVAANFLIRQLKGLPVDPPPDRESYDEVEKSKWREYLRRTKNGKPLTTDEVLQMPFKWPGT